MTKEGYNDFEGFAYTYEFNGMVLLAQLYYGEMASSLPITAFRYSHSDLDNEVFVERIRFSLDDREVCISSFSDGYLIYFEERDPETHAIIRENTISYHVTGLPQVILDMIDADEKERGEEEDNDPIEGILRDRIHHHLEQLIKKDSQCHASLEAYVSVMELREVASRCGYDDLVCLVDRHRVMDLGEML